MDLSITPPPPPPPYCFKLVKISTANIYQEGVSQILNILIVSKKDKCFKNIFLKLGWVCLFCGVFCGCYYLFCFVVCFFLCFFCVVFVLFLFFCFMFVCLFLLCCFACFVCVVVFFFFFFFFFFLGGCLFVCLFVVVGAHYTCKQSVFCMRHLPYIPFFYRPHFIYGCMAT